MKNQSFSKLFSWYYVTILALVFVVGVVATIWTYRVVSANQKKELLVNVSSVASALGAEDLKVLTGTSVDLNSEHYLSLKNKLEKIRSLNKDVRFAYLFGYRDNNIYFLVDSEPITSKDYSPPGQVYEEATLEEKEIFKKEIPSLIEFSKDRWGSWFTALVPVMEGDKVIAVLGMDVSTSKFSKNIITKMVIPIISTLFVLLLILAGLLLRRNEERRLNFKEKVLSLAKYELHSPLNNISWFLENTLEDKEEIKDKTRKSLEDLKSRIQDLASNVNRFLEAHNEDEKEK